MSVTIDPESLIVAKRTTSKNNFTYTLASRLGDMLSEAEALYGPRDKEYTFLGIEFYDNGPQSRFPRSESGKKQVIIQLSTSTLINNEVGAYWELAHECVHLLSSYPGNSPATRLEEGMATYFARDYIQRTFKQDYEKYEDSYNTSANAVRDLLSMNPNAILQMRKNQPTIFKLRASDILSACPSFPRDKAEWLVQRSVLPRPQ